MIVFSAEPCKLGQEQLQGFFVGWPNPPVPSTLLRILSQSQHAIVAIDVASTQVVGFITVLTDGVLSAYIPLLEVLPAFQRRGIGAELLTRAVAFVRGCYMIDLICDRGLQPFYERNGWRRSTGMSIRHYANQAGGRLTIDVRDCAD